MKATSHTQDKIHIIYHPTLHGYSCYCHELDGLQTEASTLKELFRKVQHLIDVRAETLRDIGKDTEAKNLKEREIVFSED